jgi:AraC-like DNA-binding protein
VSFPTFRGSELAYNGLELKWGQIVFHRSGECFHQRVGEDSGWGMISGSSAHLFASSSIVVGRAPPKPDVSRIATPRSSDYALLLRLHAQAGRVVEQNLSRMAHPEVARALEQELLLALIICLSSGVSRRLPPVHRRAAEIVIAFENELAEMPGEMPSDAELAAAINVSERALRACACRILGMEPFMYVRQKRLQSVDLALRRVGRASPALDDVARQGGFSGLEQFVDAYRTVYGEPPAILLQPES